MPLEMGGRNVVWWELIPKEGLHEFGRGFIRNGLGVV
jgi:hypothetical protein